ncbi:MAG: BMC domain-containing protein [Phycisphaerae bacterium]
MAENPAIALLEYSSVAVGTRASDALMKKAPIRLLRAGSFQPGRYAILFEGSVAAVEESVVEGGRVGESALLDQVLLPDVHRGVYDAILGRRGDWGEDTVGILETPTLSATVRGADAAMKGAEVEMVRIRLGDGLGGKGLAYFSGVQADVEAAVEIGSGAVAEHPQPVCTTIIPRFDEGLRIHLAESTRFGEDR